MCQAAQSSNATEGMPPSPAGRRTARALGAAAVVVMLFAPAWASGQEGFINREHEIKAAFVVKFAKYVTWPADAFAGPQAPLVVAALGPSGVADALSEIGRRNLQLQGRRLEVRVTGTSQELLGAHIVFLSSRLEREQRTAAIGLLAGKRVLLTGEDESFLADGGVIVFTIENNHIGGTVNLKAAEREGLKVSSELLAIFRPAN
jgi:hypothetical protein